MSAVSQDQIRIVVKSYEHKLADDAVKKIFSTAEDTGSTVVGPIPLPTQKEKFTLNRSTFVNKDAREQFEIRRHRRLLIINSPKPETMEALQTINLPA